MSNASFPLPAYFLSDTSALEVITILERSGMEDTAIMAIFDEARADPRNANDKSVAQHADAIRWAFHMRHAREEGAEA